MAFRLRTNIARPNSWVVEDSNFSPLQGEEDRPHESWLDALLKGGLFVPRCSSNPEGTRALSVLLTGPPGSGKSTLALELCSKAMYERDKNDPQETPCRNPRSHSPNCLYVTSESTLSSLQRQARSFGWKKPLIGPDEQPPVSGNPTIEVAETTNFLSYVKHNPNRWNDLLVKAVEVTLGEGQIASIVEEEKYRLATAAAKNQLKKEKPQILVIDSLNTVPATNRAGLFDSFQILTDTKDLEVVITVLDSNPNSESNDFWSFVSDVVIRMDYKYDSGYQVRNIEVVKARYQEHVWGKHQLKIYPSASQFHAPSTAKPPPEWFQPRLAYHYLETGGLFIYPSIHYHLSRVKRHRRWDALSDSNNLAGSQGRMKTPIKGLDDALGETGFPRAGCVGIIGGRGSYKSHLAYTQLLYNLSKGERGILISLRDDFCMACDTMNKILQTQSGLVEKPKDVIDWIKSGMLDAMYFPPGYVTPEEFFHRVYVAILRTKRAHRKGGSTDPAQVSLMFNSVDQLGPRFPLCTEQPIFIPGLIEMLCAENVTSFFVGVQDADQPEGQYGMLPMADTLLSAKRDEETVTLTLNRLPSGRPSGARGVLHLGDDGLTWTPV